MSLTRKLLDPRALWLWGWRLPDFERKGFAAQYAHTREAVRIAPLGWPAASRASTSAQYARECRTIFPSRSCVLKSDRRHNHDHKH
jgi:hypothetical protein